MSGERSTAASVPNGPPPAGAVRGPPDGSPTGGPPQGGPPRGGPPARTPLQAFLDSAFDKAFDLLYVAEPELKLDSSKNLRVLWVRALLASAGQLDDPVAYELLPASTRWLVSPTLAPVWAPIMDKLGWIAERTTFIDAAVDKFVAETEGERQVILIGAGYDTRALRYRSTVGLTFFEVDLPDVVTAKATMRQRYLARQPSPDASPLLALPANLNAVAGRTLEELSPLGFRRELPTLIVVEAVLFYLSPPAKAALMAEFTAHLAQQPQARLVLTDNLAPFLRSPARADAAAYFDEFSADLVDHSSLWGGAIQFALVRSKS